jgi:hypothetical protein
VSIQAKPRTLRFLLDRQDSPARCIEADYAVTLRVFDGIGENRRSSPRLGCRTNQFPQPRAIEDIIAEDQRHAILADEPAADDERLRETIRPGLLGVAQSQTEIAAIPQ